jgi:hypothetical protein
MPAEGHPDSRSEHRRVGVRLLRRLLIYHAILVAGLLLAAAVFPDFARHLPIGGVSKLVEAGELAAGKAELAVNPAETGAVDDVPSVSNALDRLGTGRQLVIILVGTWLLMLPISWVHKGIHRASVHDHSLDETC